MALTSIGKPENPRRNMEKDEPQRRTERLADG